MKSHQVSDIFLALVVGLIVGAMLVPCDEADADDGTLALALAVAKVAVNEAGFDSPADVALIYQATEAHGSTPAARLRWLRRHSPRVLGDSTRRPCLPGRNCRWTRELAASGERPPSWPRGTRYRPEAFLRVLGLATRLADGRERRRPCPVPIRSWGSRADFADNPFGWEPVRCGPARNLGARQRP